MKLLAASLLLCLPALVLTADTVDIKIPFKVASGSAKGSCDKRSALNHIFQETTDMAESAFSAINDAIGKQSKDRSAVNMLYMMFNLNGLLSFIQSGAKLPKTTKTYLSNLRTTFETLADFHGNSIAGARLYCDDTFLIYTEHTYRDGVETQDPISNDLPGATFAYWYPDKSQYVERSSKVFCDPAKTNGFNLPGLNTIVLCPALFDGFPGSSKKTLLSLDDAIANNQAAITKGDDLYNDYSSVPGTLLHEIAHLIDPNIKDGIELDENYQPVIDPDTKKTRGAYGYTACARLADAPDGGPGITTITADCLLIFAMSTYLSNWDWATSIAESPTPIVKTG